MKKILITLLLAAITAATRAALPPAENLLPADTLFVLTIPDCAALRTVGHQSPQWLCWNDPAMKPFRDKLNAKLQDALIAPLEQNLGIKLSDF